MACVYIKPHNNDEAGLYFFLQGSGNEATPCEEMIALIESHDHLASVFDHAHAEENRFFSKVDSNLGQP